MMHDAWSLTGSVGARAGPTESITRAAVVTPHLAISEGLSLVAGTPKGKFTAFQYSS
jgi:hypothetical protein